MYPCTVTLTSDVDIRIYQFEGPSFASNGFLTCEAPNGFPWFKWFGSVENTLHENIRHRHQKCIHHLPLPVDTLAVAGTGTAPNTHCSLTFTTQARQLGQQTSCESRRQIGKLVDAT